MHHFTFNNAVVDDDVYNRNAKFYLQEIELNVKLFNGY